MKMELRFGSKNAKGKKPQSIYIRLKHSNLDWDKSLGIVIEPENWDFKKREIITTKSLNNPIDTERLRELSREVYKISQTLKHKAETFCYTNTLEVKQWVKDKNRSLWIERCERWLKEYKKEIEQKLEPYFMKAYKEAMEVRNNKFRSPNTLKRWENIQANLQQYMDKKGNVRTDEFNIKVWAKMVKFFQNEYVSPQGNKVGLHKSSIKTILKKIRAVQKTMKSHYVFHPDISDKENFNISLDARKFDTLTENEISQLWNYDGGNYPVSKRRIWFFMIQYYGCFRISEVILNLTKSKAKNSRLKTPLEIWDEVEMKKNKDGSIFFVWNCQKVKVKHNQKITTKRVPIHERLAECLFGYMPKDLNDTDKFPKHLMVDDLIIHELHHQNTYRRFIKQTLKELGINKKIISHEIRKSFITNQIGKNLSFRDISNFSGHATEGAMQEYINKDREDLNTDMDLTSRV